MAEKEPVSLDALNGLLKERQRYEEWLAALEAKRASTSESVYQRVQADYQTRLREVSGKLAERAGDLVAHGPQRGGHEVGDVCAREGGPLPHSRTAQDDDAGVGV